MFYQQAPPLRDHTCRGGASQPGSMNLFSNEHLGSIQNKVILKAVCFLKPYVSEQTLFQGLLESERAAQPADRSYAERRAHMR